MSTETQCFGSPAFIALCFLSAKFRVAQSDCLPKIRGISAAKYLFHCVASTFIQLLLLVLIVIDTGYTVGIQIECQSDCTLASRGLPSLLQSFRPDQPGFQIIYILEMLPDSPVDSRQ